MTRWNCCWMSQFNSKHAIKLDIMDNEKAIISSSAMLDLWSWKTRAMKSHDNHDVAERRRFRRRSVFKRFSVHTFLNSSTLETVFDGEFIRIRASVLMWTKARSRKNKFPLSNLSGILWTGPYKLRNIFSGVNFFGKNVCGDFYLREHVFEDRWKNRKNRKNLVPHGIRRP